MIYVINFKTTGEILTSESIKEYWKNYGNNDLYGWRAPKRVYYTLGQAKTGFAHIPEKLKPHLEISEFTKSKSIMDGADLMVIQKENKIKKDIKTKEKRAKWQMADAKERFDKAKEDLDKLKVRVP